MLGQIHRCNVYTADDDYAAPFNSTPLKCRFTHNTLNTQLQNMNVRERAEAIAGRRLQYPATFDMPDNARVEWIDDPTAEGNNTFWNVVEETESMWHGVNGANVVHTCQLVKVGAQY
jgi:hypothetical protein